MLIINLFNEKFFIEGIIVEVTGILIEIILLTITIPFFIKAYNHFKNRKIIFMYKFYICQIYQKVIRLFLEMSPNDNNEPSYIKIKFYSYRFLPSERPGYFGWQFYGNLTELLQTISAVYEKDIFIMNLEKKSISDYNNYIEICKSCLTEIDHLSSAVSIPKIQLQLFFIRPLIYSLRDLLIETKSELSSYMNKKTIYKFSPYKVEKQTKLLTKAIIELFKKDKKYMDKVVGNNLIMTLIIKLLLLMLKTPFKITKIVFKYIIDCILRSLFFRKNDFQL